MRSRRLHGQNDRLDLGRENQRWPSSEQARSSDLDLFRGSPYRPADSDRPHCKGLTEDRTRSTAHAPETSCIIGGNHRRPAANAAQTGPSRQICLANRLPGSGNTRLHLTGAHISSKNVLLCRGHPHRKFVAIAKFPIGELLQCRQGKL